MECPNCGNKLFGFWKFFFIDASKKIKCRNCLTVLEPDEMSQRILDFFSTKFWFLVFIIVIFVNDHILKSDIPWDLLGVLAVYFTTNLILSIYLWRNGGYNISLVITDKRKFKTAKNLLDKME